MASGMKDYIIVSAIDFGTTYSGYAYSFKSDFKSDPLRIFTNALWRNEGDGTYKTPTTILFDKNMRFHSFGYEAEKKFADLAAQRDSNNDDDDDDFDELEEEYEEWYYYKQFKMNLYKAVQNTRHPYDPQRRRKISKEMKLKDATGKEMLAVKVFSSAISYLVRHLTRNLAERISVQAQEQGDTEDAFDWKRQIRWVLTVPAIWSDEAKQFMRNAAVEAGIPDDQLMLALEPEAASVLCKELATQKLTKEVEISAFGAGEKYLVVDCGGGTIDLTAHEVNEEGSLKELHKAAGSDIGGTNADRCFFAFLEEIVSANVLKEFALRYPSDMLELEKSFEAKKRSIGVDSDKVTISNLVHLFDVYEQMNQGKSIGVRLKEMKIHKMVNTFKRNRIRFDPKFLQRKVFEEPVFKIIQLLKDLFQEEAISSIDTILLVGGFSDSPFLHQSIRSAFSARKIVHPSEANLAVLKGAVLFGHQPQMIAERVSPMTYGIATNVDYDETKHDPVHKQLIDNRVKCTDVFKIMVKKDQKLEPEKSVFEYTFYPPSEISTLANVEVYASTSPNPTYTTDEGCKRLGELTVTFTHDPMKGKNRPIKVKFHYGFTELRVTAEEQSGGKAEAKFECLSR